jgi:hypothetical protein
MLVASATTLSVEVQQALDSLRVIGNNAVHFAKLPAKAVWAIQKRDGS